MSAGRILVAAACAWPLLAAATAAPGSDAPVRLEPLTITGQPDAMDTAHRRLLILMERQPCLGCDAHAANVREGELTQFIRWAFLPSEPAQVDEAAVMQYQIKYENKLGLDRLNAGAPGVR